MRSLLTALLQGSTRALARCITLVENEASGYEALLADLPVNHHTRVIGITGPPGAGKSTLVNGLIELLLEQGKKVGIIAVDPSSPFNYGALLGDRVRMAQHFNNDNVFIRSMASRGALGGLSPRIIEVSDLMKAAGFDYLFIETVGVGQSEVEIAGIASTTVVVVVPEAGDEIQTMKAGLMEIADIFVVNKADRDNADAFVKNLRILAHSRVHETAVLKTVATTSQGLKELIQAIDQHQQHLTQTPEKHAQLLTEKAWQLIQRQRMKAYNRQALYQQIKTGLEKGDFNLYRFLQSIYAAE
ncbi:methylmalonyl Co-A mutase-associated GTPase MeaB [Chitinophaga sancti]|uniref:LAO/AO transport system kinase n=1 Tax=Chitinophaga sancti TaxID=1004 RepID=A0A1K1NVX1_9BACT|nr:methylmalonyl Co-A mutase-associated GTPase MeaB [Chitinophaga sancti]WQD60248.1 methylmalonyl Co-A mutase-associated GTPase MeaB [Chitinophaga sancti]WQG87624.1 methylmalonyl Co-A mutase-associated GTPase MeaB [Chitinophaga sancti]SFW39674.1 LAO/AO transport system kinase [Chitinophaga sancti]